MAGITIQRKKKAPSPWLLVVLAVVALAVGGWFWLQIDANPDTQPLPAHIPGTPASWDLPLDSVSELAVLARADSASKASRADSLAAAAAPAAENSLAANLATQAATNPAAPDYARNGLLLLRGTLVVLTDGESLRDAATDEQRDNLTSATSRLNEANTSLRPGFVAAAGLIRLMQQNGYPALEGPANDLVRLAGQLSGRSATAAEQQQNQQFLTQAAAAVRVLSEPAR